MYIEKKCYNNSQYQLLYVYLQYIKIRMKSNYIKNGRGLNISKISGSHDSYKKIYVLAFHVVLMNV